MNVLVIDVGGSRVKFRVTGKTERRSFSSGKQLTPKKLVECMLALTDDWKFDAVSIGYPGPTLKGQPVVDAKALGKGWTRFNFAKHLKKPTKVINDATMQAIGSYRGGRMLFLGLGTGLGSTLISDHIVVPLELGDLPFPNGKSLDKVLGKPGVKKLGRAKWSQALKLTVHFLRMAFRPDYIVIGGGNVELLKALPEGTRRGSNENAFIGGARLWKQPPSGTKVKGQTWRFI